MKDFRLCNTKGCSKVLPHIDLFSRKSEGVEWYLETRNSVQNWRIGVWKAAKYYNPGNLSEIRFVMKQFCLPITPILFDEASFKSLAGLVESRSYENTKFCRVSVYIFQADFLYCHGRYLKYFRAPNFMSFLCCTQIICIPFPVVWESSPLTSFVWFVKHAVCLGMFFSCLGVCT